MLLSNNLKLSHRLGKPPSYLLYLSLSLSTYLPTYLGISSPIVHASTHCSRSLISTFLTRLSFCSFSTYGLFPLISISQSLFHKTSHFVFLTSHRLYDRQYGRLYLESSIRNISVHLDSFKNLYFE